MPEKPGGDGSRVAYGNSTEEEESEDGEPEAEAGESGDLDNEGRDEDEALEGEARVGDEWTGMDFEGGPETVTGTKTERPTVVVSEVVTSTGHLLPDTTPPSTGDHLDLPTPKTGGQVLAFPVPTSTGQPVLGIPANPFSDWNFAKGKPPWPEGWELSPKGERKIGRKTFVGYQYLWVVKCPDCGCRVQRKTGRHFSPTQVAMLLEKSLETQRNLVKLRLFRKAREIAFHRRCAECATRLGSALKEAGKE